MFVTHNILSKIVSIFVDVRFVGHNITSNVKLSQNTFSITEPKFHYAHVSTKHMSLDSIGALLPHGTKALGGICVQMFAMGALQLPPKMPHLNATSSLCHNKKIPLPCIKIFHGSKCNVPNINSNAILWHVKHVSLSVELTTLLY